MNQNSVEGSLSLRQEFEKERKKKEKDQENLDFILWSKKKSEGEKRNNNNSSSSSTVSTDNLTEWRSKNEAKKYALGNNSVKLCSAPKSLGKKKIGEKHGVSAGSGTSLLFLCDFERMNMQGHMAEKPDDFSMEDWFENYIPVCGYRFSASEKRSDKTWIKSVALSNDSHDNTCGGTSQLSVKMLVDDEIFCETIATDPIASAKAIKTSKAQRGGGTNTTFNTVASYTLSRAKSEVLKEVSSSYEDSFKHWPLFLLHLKKQNPEAEISCEMDENGVF